MENSVWKVEFVNFKNINSSIEETYVIFDDHRPGTTAEILFQIQHDSSCYGNVGRLDVMERPARVLYDKSFIAYTI